MRDLVGEAELLGGRRAVAAADDGHGAALGERLRHGLGAVGKGRELENAHGAVPDDGARAARRRAEKLNGLGTDVHAHHVGGNVHRVHHDRLGVGGELLRRHGIHRQQELDALCLGLLDHLERVGALVLLEQRLADLAALRLGEGVGHAAADDDGVGLFEQVVDDGDLIADLCAAEHRDEWALGIVERLAHDLQLLGDQQAGDGGQVRRHAGSGGVRAVDGAESVGNVDLGHGGKLLGKRRIVLGFALFKAGVLEQHDLAALERRGLGLGVGTDDVMREDDRLAEELGKTLGNGGEGELL